MSKEVVGHCGKEGRIARAVVRESIVGKRYDSPEKRAAIAHVESCSCCQARISACALEAQDRTVYSETVDETLTLAEKTKPSYKSRLWSW